MDFKSFNKQRIKTDERKIPQEEDIRKTAEKYGNMSDEDLLSNILQTANQNKANGTLSEESLRQFANSVSPMLNQEQKSRLEKAIRMIRGN